MITTAWMDPTGCFSQLTSAAYLLEKKGLTPNSSITTLKMRMKHHSMKIKIK